MEHSLYKNVVVLVVLLSVAAVMFEPVQTLPVNDRRSEDLLRWRNFLISRKRDIVNRLLRERQASDPTYIPEDKKDGCIWNVITCMKKKK